MKYRRPRVLVLGDLMLDIWMRVNPRVSNPEGAAAICTGTPDMRDEMPGGAGLVAALMSNLGVSVKLLSRIGHYSSDSIAYMLLREAGVNCRSLSTSRTYTLPLKMRYVNAHGVVVFRYDEEQPADTYFAQESKDFDFAVYEKFVQRADCVVVADYGKGFCQDAGPKIINAAKYFGVPTIVGAKPQLLAKYAGADIIKVNQAEAETFLTEKLGPAPVQPKPRPYSPGSLAKMVAAELDAAAAIVTAGGDGSGIAVRRAKTEDQSAPAAFDIFEASAAACFPVIKNCVGAGDAFLAGLVYELMREPHLQSAGFSGLPLEPSRICCATAAGAATASQFLEHGHIEIDATAPFLAARAQAIAADRGAKLITREEAHTLCCAWRAANQKIVFTNGCFDLLHPGHVYLLERAQQQGHRLIVAVNTDESVRRLKGESRPVQDFDSRVRMLASLSCVDAIVPLDALDNVSHAELRALLASLTPDVLVKGAEYKNADIVGWEEVVNRDPPGKIWRCPMVGGCSTTQLIEKVQNGKQ